MGKTGRWLSCSGKATGVRPFRAPASAWGTVGRGRVAIMWAPEPRSSHCPGPPLPPRATGSRFKDPAPTRTSPPICLAGPLRPGAVALGGARTLPAPRILCPRSGLQDPHPPEASSVFASTSNSAVMWVTSLDGDFRPRRLFLEESHLKFTKVTWQFSGQRRDRRGKGGTGQEAGSS